MFREKNFNTGFEIGKTGIIPVSVLTIQYRIGNTKDAKVRPIKETSFTKMSPSYV
jgi:hypothetical protein